jgi:hypothetical protein
MNLESVTAELRPRGPWEAMDLGARMVRRDAGVIYRTWFIVTLPLVILASLGMIYLPTPGWVMLAYWWLEPLTDGPILHVISQRLFGGDTDTRSALRSVPAHARRNILFLLTPMRFHFARSLAVPVTQLEGLTRQQRRARARVLNNVALNHGIGLTTAYQHLMLCLYLGVILFGYLLVPEAYRDTLGSTWIGTFLGDGDTTTAGNLLTLYIFYIAQTILHPWYVGAGFGLYINCRTMLEAWDIEVAFRRMLQRRATRAGAAAVVAAVAVAGLAEPVRAEVREIEPYWPAEVVEEATAAVFDDEAMDQYETVEEWRQLEPDRDDERASETTGLNHFFEALGRSASIIVELGLWIAVALALLFAFATRRHWLPYLRYGPGEERRPRQRIVLDSGVITAEELPDDVPDAVLGLWSRGRLREALSLLYRSSVFSTVEKHGVRLPRSATEGECVSAVRSQAPAALASYFDKVVTAWLWYAYGGRAPAEEAVQSRCRDWPAHYGSSA